MLGPAYAVLIVLAAAPGDAQELSDAVTPVRAARTRLVVEVRPFLSLTGNGGGGAITDVVIEHKLLSHLLLRGELAPIAVGIDRHDAGAIAHARLGAAFTTHLLELGLSAGSRVQNLGAGGYSLAARLRLGPADGLSLAVGYGYVVARNYYTSRVGASFSNLRIKATVPVSQGARLFLEGAFSYDVWIYGIVGLEQALGGSLADAPWRLSLGFGPAWVIDRFGCAPRYPVPCAGSSAAVGPAMGLGAERRF
jgi:hypothetical protein